MNPSHQSILWVVIPAYNEQEALPLVLKEWHQALREALGKNQFQICVLNDGSKDQTLDILNGEAKKYSELLVIDKTNSGHGQTCLTGYRIAIQNEAQWILQIDSDGQCDPQFFQELWSKRETSSCIMGYRKRRLDGAERFLISRLVSIFVLLATGTWIRDANVPYRLMNTKALTVVLPFISNDFALANIYLSYLMKRFFGIIWVDIVFRDRSGGSPSVKTFSFAKHGFRLLSQLRRAIAALPHKEILETAAQLQTSLKHSSTTRKTISNL